ncbi:MAG: hypothetical protein JWP89_7032 [Schlesneria sp.]|nr:hypothetical protein [Schlesneria sp.]
MLQFILVCAATGIIISVADPKVTEFLTQASMLTGLFAAVKYLMEKQNHAETQADHKRDEKTPPTNGS